MLLHIILENTLKYRLLLSYETLVKNTVLKKHK